MGVDLDKLEVVHNELAKRFEIALGDELAIIEYSRQGNQINYYHTEVPQAFEGLGVGSKLAHAVMEYARENDLKVLPSCPFVASYVRRHKEYQSISLGHW